MEQKKVEMHQKVFNLLHMASRAGKLKVGYQEAERMISAKKAQLLLIANDLSEQSKKKLSLDKVNYKLFSTKKEISVQLNRKETGILCVINKDFANGIANLFTLRMED